MLYIKLLSLLIFLLPAVADIRANGHFTRPPEGGHGLLTGLPGVPLYYYGIRKGFIPAMGYPGGGLLSDIMAAAGRLVVAEKSSEERALLAAEKKT